MSKSKISDEAKQAIIDTKAVAESFITQPLTDTKPQETKPIKAAQTVTTKFNDIKQQAKETGQMELKTRRVCLLMQPTIYEAVKSKAAAEGISVNEYIHRLAEQAING